ncbi:1-acyl-sn-glycerol-3-phosphate acyltransferase [Myxococcota bacterium]|nr:1-acyl-sn-glycerol-3-phosphate acyltransferase [Myxococcota bacterium]
MTWIGRRLGRLILKASGWSYEPPPAYWAPRQVVIAYPHTSLYDAVLAFSLFQIIDKRAATLIKAEAFRSPIGWLLRRFGALPITRDRQAGGVARLVEEINARDEVALCVMPEGTRRRVAHIKSGFWHIAKAAGVQIVCTYVDPHRKHIGWIGALRPSDDMAADMYAIQAMYASVGATLPLPKGLAPAPDVEAAASAAPPHAP